METFFPSLWLISLIVWKHVFFHFLEKEKIRQDQRFQNKNMKRKEICNGKSLHNTLISMLPNSYSIERRILCDEMQRCYKQADFHCINYFYLYWSIVIFHISSKRKMVLLKHRLSMLISVLHKRIIIKFYLNVPLGPSSHKYNCTGRRSGLE